MDKEYWSDYYKEKGYSKFTKPSLFALRCIKQIKRDDIVFELGAGNGRDSIYFASVRGCQVYALDQYVGEEVKKYTNPKFIQCDFPSSFPNEIPDEHISPDIIYSRFTWHSITAEDESNLLSWLSAWMKPNGLLMIEARSIHDDLYGRGKFITTDTFKCDNHCRRFIDPIMLNVKLSYYYFKIIYYYEGIGLAPRKAEDPYCVRVIAQCRR